MKEVGEYLYGEFHLQDDQVWTRVPAVEFNYSDGQQTEKYLEQVLNRASDLSSDSVELEQWIRDWPSEYHLSRKRAQLLKGFDFDRKLRVLEVGCGCGAITRFLGETFDEVIAVEGSRTRAHLARLRTRGLDNVTVVCSPFQDLRIKKPFDIIFCIGVFEYAGSFVQSADPYEAMLDSLASALTETGTLLIAIENQFGLKYFASCREDHTRVRFDGLEGYPRFPGKVRTFGYTELANRLAVRFPEHRFYFPYPDYKMPDCILSEELLGDVQVSELVGNLRSRDYTDGYRPMFDERLVSPELARNKMLPLLANSFLVVAGRKADAFPGFGQLAIMHSGSRVPKFQTITRIHRDAGSLWVTKKPVHATGRAEHSGPVSLVAARAEWKRGATLSGLLVRRVLDRARSPEELFSPCRVWYQTLVAQASIERRRPMLEGRFLDCHWQNSFVSGSSCEFIDQEWVWHERIPLNVLVLRAIYLFLVDQDGRRTPVPGLDHVPGWWRMRRVARMLGVGTTLEDFLDFLALETLLTSKVYGVHRRKALVDMMPFLLRSPASKRALRAVRAAVASVAGSALRLFR